MLGHYEYDMEYAASILTGVGTGPSSWKEILLMVMSTPMLILTVSELVSDMKAKSCGQEKRRFLEDNHTLTFIHLPFLNCFISDEGLLKGLLYWLAGCKQGVCGKVALSYVWVSIVHCLHFSLVHLIVDRKENPS